MTTPPTTKISQLILRVTLVMLTLAVAGEAVLRALIVKPASIEMHDSLGWLYAPGSTIRHSSEGYALNTANSLGLIGPEPRVREEPVSLVILGDSFVEALQLPAAKNFTSLIERSGPCNSVLNAGRSGISPIHFPVMLEHVETFLDTQALVMVVSPGDRTDIENSSLAIKTDANQAIQKIDFTPPELNRLRQTLDPVLRRSALATYLMNRLKATLAAKPAGKPAKASEDSAAVSQRNEDILGFQFNLTAQQRPSVVLYLPELEYLPNNRAVSTGRSTEFAQTVVRASSQADVHFIDTTNALIELYRRSGQPGHGFANNSVTSGHLNESGHQVVANELKAALVDKGLCN